MTSLSARLRRRFLHHWFVGVFAIIGGLWLVTTLAYALGAGGISFGNRYTGQRARIDFQRGHDVPVLALGHDAGLVLHGGPTPRGTVVKLRPGLPLVFCWACGRDEAAGAIADVEFRQGTWWYRAPVDVAAELAALPRAGGSARWRAARTEIILTVAYDQATGARRQVAPTATVEDQARALAELGLRTDAAARLSEDGLADLPRASMQREGCVIVHLAFVAVVLLWLVVGGVALALVALVRRLRRRSG
ncbi:MAG: hypothetical protein IPL61_35510 [Myxococcales bacterium]|nr:hypothetical protein [Myxococcales bacterium]